LKVTVLEPWLAPKEVPVIVTGVPTDPLLGARLVVPDLDMTVNATPALATPPTEMTTFPVVAPAGTGTMMLVADHVIGVPMVPLKVSTLVPCVTPKLVPAIVTTLRTRALVGARLVTVGGGAVTVNATPMLAIPPTLTTTLPVVAPAGTRALMLVADHAVGAAVMPLKVTVLAPWLAPKLVPAIVTAVPTNPLVGARLVTVGGGTAVTVNATPLLATPPAVTTTLPVVAPAGTCVLMLVADHVVGAAVMPLKVTVFVP
jgi:hypothetical protein